MKNYVYIYHAEQNTPPAPEAMAAWSAWFDTLGDKLVDAGNPITTVKAVLKDGKSSPENDDVVGYSIVKAASLDDAIAMAKGSPLADTPGCAVRVYETGEM